MNEPMRASQPFARIALEQRDGRLIVSLTWADAAAVTDAFEWRSDRAEQPLAAAPVAHGSTTVIEEELSRFASSEAGAWTLWVQDPGASWSEVAGAPRMQASAFAPVVHGDAIACPAATAPRRFAIQTGTPRPARPSLVTTRLSSGRDLVWEGRLANVDAQADVYLAFVERTTGARHRVDVQREVAVGASALLATEGVAATVPWATVQPSLAMDWFDVHLVVARPGWDDVTLGIPRPAFASRIRHRFGPGRSVGEDAVRHYAPFFTFKARRLAIHVSTLSVAADATLRRVSKFVRLRRLVRSRRRPLWVIGETGYKAQDTGFHLFSYLREHHPEIDARFVIDADAPDRASVEAVGPVLIHGTPEHVEAILLADRIACSHHPEYLYPVRTTAFKRSVHATKVFLQHGVMGTKWMADLYGRGNGGFETDLFLVSSPFEKHIIERDFGYRPSRVKVTGLPRFDALLAPSRPQAQLLVIPTWRDWILTPEAFEASDFYREWLGLVASEEFRGAVERGGWHVRMILHPNFRQYAPVFEAQGIEVVRQGEVAVQELLRQSAVLITDYSSVGFDFALQRRPVVYFQFDRARFLGARGSHMDLDAVLPGQVEFTRAGVIEAIADLLEDPQVSADDFAKATRFFPMMDRSSSERVVAAIAGARGTFRALWFQRLSALASGAYRRFRRSRFYLPYVKAIYRGARLLPLQRDRVLFESGLGVHYGDSPRAIYLALRAARPDLRKTWAYNGPFADGDDKTDVVERLTIRYFTALARAGYMVNNQSFPHYVRRRRGQVFVQTWHGTPLKRMANDLATVMGRDEGYIDRATTAARQWSVLVSPNPHTTARMRTAFGYEGEVLELGYPRNDILHGKRAKRARKVVRRRLGIGKGRRLVLFAPTFRDRTLGQSETASPAAAIGLGEWAEELGDTATLLVRRHVLDKGALEVPEGSESAILDVTAYPDMQELLAAADVLVTDYSSVYFDYLNLRRPVVFFAPDVEDYGDVVRGFYLDYPGSLPGPMTSDAAEARAWVRAALEDGVSEGYDLDAYAREYCPHDDGHAARRVVDRVFGEVRG